MLCLRRQLLYRRCAHSLILTSLIFGISACLPVYQKRPTLSTLLEQRLNTYRTVYPEIEFVLLRSISNLQTFIPFTQQLGPQARNIDYAHPPDLREALMEAQQQRIAHLLVNRQPSATLFELGTASRWKKPFLCLLTYNKSIFVKDKRAATRFMLDLSEADIHAIPDEQLLNNTQFALYTLDHEIFHCLDGYHNGPLYPMTMSDIKSLHDQYLVEMRAEIFASFAHLIRYPNQVSLLHNLALVRILNLASWDPTHYTASILTRLASLPTDVIPNVGLLELAQISTAYAQSWSLDLSRYKSFLTAAYKIAVNMGVSRDVFTQEILSLSTTSFDERVYNNLAGELSHAINTYIQNTLPAP